MEASSAEQEHSERVSWKGTAQDWFARMESPLIWFVKGIVGPEGDAGDVVQETFVRFAKAGRLDQPRAWLYRTARNLALNQRRKRAREVRLDDRTDALAEPVDVASGRPDATAERLERHGFLRSVLARLPEKKRRVIEYKYVESLSYAEIAERTGLSPGNVGYILSTTLRELLVLLEKEGLER